MSVIEALQPGWAVAVCGPCRQGERGPVPADATFDGPWRPYSETPCASCDTTISAKPGGFTAHPNLQRCYACDARKPRVDFNEHNWMKLQRHGICETCRTAYPELVKRWRREGMPVMKFGRVIGRLEGCPPPYDDPFAKDNKDAYWRVIYAPEPLPGRPPRAAKVLDETCTYIPGGRAHLRTWHGKQPEDRAFRWVEAYRKRWAQQHPEEPTQIELFTEQEVTERWGDKCVVCSGPFEHLDHWVPIAARGPHTLANVRPMCASHNLSKGEAADFQV
jgi:hypothetical protein